MSKNKKPNVTLRATIIGGVLQLISCFLIGIAGVTHFIPSGTGELNGVQMNYGVRTAINNYFRLWRPWQFPNETAYIAEVIVLIACGMFLVTAILAIIKKQYLNILTGALLACAMGFFPFLLVLTIPMVQMGVLAGRVFLYISIATAINIAAIIVLAIPQAGLVTHAAKLVVGEDEAEEEGEKEEEAPAAEEEAEPTITEKEVREIAKEEVHEHELNLHKNGAVVAPVEEEPKEEEPVEEEPAPAEPVKEEEPEEEPEEEAEEAEEEGEEEAAPADPTNPYGSKRRRAKFETRLKNSEFDLRHKYYDLRDYIKWYGVNNRISIPGDTFSLHRKRLAFITINGKHLKLYAAIDPKRYASSTFPVETIDSKRFEGLPTMIRVRSDLSYRRAKQIIDDVMSANGIAKPEGPEPVETQDENPED